MKTYVAVLLPLMMLSATHSTAQNSVLGFLEGTWKVDGREIYERWEILANGSMKGRSYRIVNGVEETTEFLTIRQRGEEVIYTAKVFNQNEGQGIDFVLNRPDSLTFSFENPDHDFPKVIRYRVRTASEIYVQVSDGEQKGFAYIMVKVVP